MEGRHRRCLPAQSSRWPHPAGTVEDNLIERRTHLNAVVVIGDYSQHRRSFLTGAPTPAELVLVQRGRYVAPASESPIHRFRSYLQERTAFAERPWAIGRLRG